MIHLFGDQETSEYKAACTLCNLIQQVWPSIADASEHDIRIVAGAKCHGQEVKDIDLLLMASFGKGITYSPFLSFNKYEQVHRPDSVVVESLFVSIELKDHSPNNVHFLGTNVHVRYKQYWHDATEQSHKQVFSIKRFIEFHRIKAPHITNLIWLRNVPNTELPKRPHNVIGADATWGLFLNVIGQMSPPRKRAGEWVLSASNQDFIDLNSAVELFTKEIQPSRLDRKRMELISKQAFEQEAFDAAGEKLLILRGRGGTGKTLRLLRLAYRLYEEEDARILLLTYNKALVSDIRRLLTILGIPDDIAARTIQIRTLHSFIREIFDGFGILQEDKNFLEDYENLKKQALKYIDEGVATSEDIDVLKGSKAAFQWDYVFVDEGQDWLAGERDILRKFYPPAQVVVADGVDQFVLSQIYADWKAGLTRSERQISSLKTILRMKAGLVRFVSLFADRLGLMGLEWVANEESPGGRIIIVEGSYFQDRELHDRLLADNKRDGNEPVDMLFCVPPGQVGSQRETKQRQSLAANYFQDWGFPVWDGASKDVRQNYPTEIDQLRIVQYESCRGLEGWTVVNLGLDQFYDNKFNNYIPDSEKEVEYLKGDTSPAHLYASRWLLIPMTRAMDTLVIQIGKKDSPVRDALKFAAEQYADFVEWVSRP